MKPVLHRITKRAGTPILASDAVGRCLVTLFGFPWQTGALAVTWRDERFDVP
jgi:hypothetical protein